MAYNMYSRFIHVVEFSIVYCRNSSTQTKMLLTKSSTNFHFTNIHLAEYTNNHHKCEQNVVLIGRFTIPRTYPTSRPQSSLKEHNTQLFSKANSLLLLNLAPYFHNRIGAGTLKQKHILPSTVPPNPYPNFQKAKAQIKGI